MNKNKGFVISTMLYSIFGIMLVIIFYILYLLVNNRILLASNIDILKERLSTVVGENDIIYSDRCNANSPVLADGMIPIVYDNYCDGDEATDNAGGCWEVADITQKWYSYCDQWWANAAKVSNYSDYLNEDGNLIVGSEIPMDNIISMWVWIPRFKYRILNGLGSTSQFTSPEISVVFEKGTKTTGVSESQYRNEIENGTVTSYYTHPAFRNGNRVYDEKPYDLGGWSKELTGFWVGKFRTGGEATSPRVKPDIEGYITGNTMDSYNIPFLTAHYSSFALASGDPGQSTNSNDDSTSHVMKNTEWGAVAYLSHSHGNKNIYMNDCGTNTIYSSSPYITGRSSGSVGYSATSETPRYGTYSYNNVSCSSDKIECVGEIANSKGTGASTTGNIYGIYDMNSYIQESVMANKNYSNDLTGIVYDGNGNPLYNADGEILTYEISIYWINDAYLDIYSDCSSFLDLSLECEILGDATWETQYWYNSAPSTLNNDTYWVKRGYTYIHEQANSLITIPAQKAYGIFNSASGSGSVFNSFHAVLIP